MIPVCAYVSTSVSTFFLYLTVYIALFWVYRFRPRAKTRTSKRNHHKVCVIGGGLSGVVTVKELLQKGHDVVGIEASKSLGGSFTETYDGCYLSVSNHWMAFSDFPVKRNDRVFLTARQYVTYLLEYAEHFNVLKHYEFETKVVSVKRCSKSKYLVTTSDGQTRSFTAVVVATVRVCVLSPSLSLSLFSQYTKHTRTTDTGCESKSKTSKISRSRIMERSDSTFKTIPKCE